MKTGLRLLLVVSLLANVVGGIGLFLKSREAAPAQKKLAAIRKSAEAASGSEVRTALSDASLEGDVFAGPFRGDSTDHRLRDLGYVKAALLSEGFPAELVGKILEDVRYELLGGYELETIRPRPPEVQQRLQQIWDEIRPPGPFPGPNEIARYGDLPAETMRTVQKVASDLKNASDREFIAALQPLLTAAQMGEFEKFNSLLARRVQVAVASLDVDEATYTALWEAAVQREGSAAPAERFRNYVWSPSGAQAIEDYRRVLGDDRFVRILGRLDEVSASADAVYQVAGLTPTQRADLFAETFRARHAAFQAGARDPDGVQKATRLREELIRQASLTPEQIAGFDRMELGAVLKRGDFGQGGTLLSASR